MGVLEFWLGFSLECDPPKAILNAGPSTSFCFSYVQFLFSVFCFPCSFLRTLLSTRVPRTAFKWCACGWW